MDHDEPGWPLLDDFFAHEARGRAAPTVRRYLRVRHRLVQLLETGDLSPALGTDDATLLSAEREFHLDGAFWHLFGADELVCVLPMFLRPPWLPAGSAEARTQISLVARLLAHLGRRRLIDVSITRGALWEAEAAVRQARHDLEAQAAEAGPVEGADRMPGRFRQDPGPTW